ncbi:MULTISPECIES: hypothetical protein [Paraburkholderia]|uniref:hypothetical protein n=1 Tax=Paraburkholderia TaxID=1822464 RepID=UPI0003747779|nr:hypothetical protein [Paraburkholderia caledonica]
MLSLRVLLFMAAALLAIASAFGDSRVSTDAPARVRGTVVAIDHETITLKERSGRTFTLKTGSFTTYADVVPSSFDAIKPNDFIGTASKGPRNHWTAVEIVLIPDSMRAGRAGYASWDPLPDTSGANPSGTIATSMTNGVVSGVSSATPKLTNTSMTNGIVSARSSSEAGHVLTVILVGNKAARIVVPSTAPVTRFIPVDRSAVAVGSTVFIKTVPGNKAGLIAVGRGIVPPM